jgi:hypothetical protein
VHTHTHEHTTSLSSTLAHTRTHTHAHTLAIAVVCHVTKMSAHLFFCSFKKWCPPWCLSTGAPASAGPHWGSACLPGKLQLPILPRFVIRIKYFVSSLAIPCTVNYRSHGQATFPNLLFYPRLFRSIFWEQGFDKVRKSSRTLELFEQFDVQFWKWRILLVSHGHTRPKHACIVLRVYNIV